MLSRSPVYCGTLGFKGVFEPAPGTGKADEII